MREAQERTDLDLRMGEEEFESWVRRSTRRDEDASLASRRRKARRRCAGRFRAAAVVPENLPVWTVGVLGFPDSEYVLHEQLDAAGREVFAALAPEYRGSIGELIADVRTLLAPGTTSSTRD